ncbi:MAG: stage III sporulation protein AB [Candidatus Borkfalkiaceae bacterium]|nr:stage III sporulation protein AB [Christensenellaceae bacterium]
MKYVLGAVLLSLSTFCGYVLSFRYRERLNFYSDFYSFNERLKTAVSFTLQTLGSLVKDDGKSDFPTLLRGFINDGKRIKDKPSALSPEERDFFWDYAESIGKSDRFSQLDYLNGSEKTIAEKLKKSESEYKKYKPVCVKLGFLFGLILFVLVM